LSLGGKITQASNHLSLMLNGLKYYSLEVTINGDHYLIQAFEQEASDLFNAVMVIIDEKKTAITKIEKIFRKSILLDLNFS
jgi:ribosome-associated translation inhibitor RaiA